MSARVLAAGVVALLLGGCAEGELAINSAKQLTPQQEHRGIYKVGDPYQINGVWYYPAEDWNYDETGIASWYGPGFHERFTANGEIYDQNDLTAAHRTLPMPSFVRVTNLDNGRSIVLRVNDRGPYARGRIIDVSRRGAQLLGFETIGTARVRVQIMAKETQELAATLKQQGHYQVARAQTQPGEPPPVAAPRSAVSSTPLAAPPSAAPAPQPAAPQPAPTGVAAAGAPPPSNVTVAALPPPAAPAAAAPAPIMAQPTPAPAPAPAAGSAPGAGTPVAFVPPPDPTGQVAQSAPRHTNIYVQAGAFANRDNATRLSGQLKAFGPTVVSAVVVSGQQLYRVRVGPLTTVEEGDRTLDLVVNAGHPEARLVVD
ncbi:MAG TPA: septal ring lytic transglycosylase RlpA family protein [Candidatus Sulfotelmatobacter sp.]|nr:septal ring lytic transglycosylase RlpA family protein [Candidatus Sulfotelmatobacter sp.]